MITAITAGSPKSTALVAPAAVNNPRPAASSPVRSQIGMSPAACSMTTARAPAVTAAIT